MALTLLPAFPAACVDRVISFTKLHNTEKELFFPWLRELIPKEALPPLADFDREREGVVKIAKKIGQVLWMRPDTLADSLAHSMRD